VRPPSPQTEKARRKPGLFLCNDGAGRHEGARSETVWQVAQVATCSRRSRFIAVMAGLDPAIHGARPATTFACYPKRFGVNGRDKPGHDDGDDGTALLNFQTGRRPTHT
jgi:hypothetical protein